MPTAVPTHRNDEFHRGQVPTDQIASGTDTSGYVPVANGSGGVAWAAQSGGSDRAAASTTPAAVGTGAVGTGTTDARADHVHATGAGTPVTQAFGDAAATGTGPAAAMTDHKHGMPSLPSGVGARVYNNAAFSVAASTETAITFNTERSDSDALHSVSSNTSRMTIPSGKDGRYIISGAAEWAASALGTLRRLSIRLNGSTYIAKTELTSIINAALPQDVSTVYDLVATDYVELVAFQDTVGAVNLQASGNYSPEFAVGMVAASAGGGGGLGAWTTDTPSWTTSGTAPAIGNGVLTARYKALDANTYLYYLNFTAGSTTTFGTGTWSFSLPFTSVASRSQVMVGWILDAGTDNKLAVANITGGSTSIAQVTPEGGNVVDNGTPQTWAVSDQLTLSGMIEV